MSIFDGTETLCNREDNRCKQRNQCKRYMTERDPNYAAWEADYYREFGQFCKHFIEIPKVGAEKKKKAGN